MLFFVELSAFSMISTQKSIQVNSNPCETSVCNREYFTPIPKRTKWDNQGIPKLFGNSSSSSGARSNLSSDPVAKFDARARRQAEVLEVVVRGQKQILRQKLLLHKERGVASEAQCLKHLCGKVRVYAGKRFRYYRSNADDRGRLNKQIFRSNTRRRKTRRGAVLGRSTRKI